MNPEKKRNIAQEIKMEMSRLKIENPIRYCILYLVIYELRFANESLQITAAFEEGSSISTHTVGFLLFNLCIVLLFMHATYSLPQKLVQIFIRINCSINRFLQK